MLHACVERFDVMGGRGNILGWDGEVSKAQIDMLGRGTADTLVCHSQRLISSMLARTWYRRYLGLPFLEIFSPT
jgi:hypothetical protein